LHLLVVFVVTAYAKSGLPRRGLTFVYLHSLTLIDTRGFTMRSNTYEGSFIVWFESTRGWGGGERRVWHGLAYSMDNTITAEWWVEKRDDHIRWRRLHPFAKREFQ